MLQRELTQGQHDGDCFLGTLSAASGSWGTDLMQGTVAETAAIYSLSHGWGSPSGSRAEEGRSPETCFQTPPGVPPPAVCRPRPLQPGSRAVGASVWWQLCEEPHRGPVDIVFSLHLLFCSSQADPKELILMVTRHVTRCGQDALPEDVASLARQLGCYNERLLDLTQAQVLRGLRRGVDVQRFASDERYKRETVLGLVE